MENKYLKRYLGIAFLLLFFNFKSHSKTIDTAKVILNAKMNIIDFTSDRLSSDEIIRLVQSNCDYKFLKSKGFIDIVFFTITLHSDSISTRNIFDKLAKDKLYSYSFVFGYNLINGNIYKLKGSRENDFGSLFAFLKRDFSAKTLSSEKEFLSNFYIENVDLGCLYSSYRQLLSGKYPRNECYQPANPIYSGIQW